MSDIRKTTRLTLIEPIMYESRQITHLDFRRMKGKDIRDMEGYADTLEKTAFIIGALTGHGPDLFDELDSTDIDAASKIVEGFMKRKAGRPAST